ncbi:MAG: aliphatic sulfonate ABC transporter substrate-binding protein [Brevibacterium yomogidense]|uniref:Putative aliphatic sulfonates-binding protein n=1 Tax=Brevibacterium yomogidense TaxID=946573 RepID=A0A1X6XBI8_9MICO|nr:MULTISPECIES: aliphatic sulfonate ABC transporter substrate-binding protein [Brevibacterium]SLM96612.1 Alkanesulfonates-binding protein [Brevibacterium yomogidense]SMX94889.1 sulfonate transport system substrate-binding protein [Brevibacterium sp. Mu109]
MNRSRPSRARTPRSPRTLLKTAALAAVGSLMLTGCMEGEDAAQAQTDTLAIDWATYNPLSLVIKEKGWLESALAEDGVDVEWVFSAGSNKANESLRAETVDIGSTAGSAALLARANGSPIKVVDLYSQPEWSALVAGPDSDVESVEDLEGRSVAATKGTDPYFFLVQALAEADLTLDDVTVQNIQHADGRTALSSGEVDAWSGLDPIMAAAESEGDELFYRNLDFNTYGFLNAREDFLESSPELAQTVLDVYAHARTWALENQEETASILAEAASIDEETAGLTMERTHLDIDPVPGDEQLEVLRRIGPTLVEIGDVAEQSQVDEAIDTIIDDRFASEADAARVADTVAGTAADTSGGDDA